MIVKNFGLSPAFNVRESSVITVLPFPLTAALNIYPSSIPAIPISKVTIFPTDEFQINTESKTVLTQETINEIMDGSRVRLYVIGKLTYEDIFGKTHFTHTCAVLWWRQIRHYIL